MTRVESTGVPLERNSRRDAYELCAPRLRSALREATARVPLHGDRRLAQCGVLDARCPPARTACEKHGGGATSAGVGARCRLHLDRCQSPSFQPPLPP